MADAATWTPRVLGEYEIGKAMAAIESICLLSKPIAEVGCRKAPVAALECDLRDCLALAPSQGVKFWTRMFGDRVRYGFYRDAWTLAALDFLDRSDLTDTDRSWISGLLFGYRSEAIQDFISNATPDDRSGAEITKRSLEAVASRST